MEPSDLKPKPLYYDELPEFDPVIPAWKEVVNQTLNCTGRLIKNYLKDGLRKRYYLWMS